MWYRGIAPRVRAGILARHSAWRFLERENSVGSASGESLRAPSRISNLFRALLPICFIRFLNRTELLQGECRVLSVTKKKKKQQPTGQSAARFGQAVMLVY